jgi:hypothetical protein
VASPDVRGDALQDEEGGIWLTYAELARARGIDRASAAKLVLRRRWRRQKDNQGTVRVLVPAEWADPSHDKAQDDATDSAPDVAQAIGALEHAVAAAAEREKQLRAERDAVLARADAERGRADAAEREREEARIRAAAAEAEAKGLREALAEARRPFWRRWLGS